MKIKKSIFVSFFEIILLCFCQSIFCQTSNKKLFTADSIPPLSVFLDSALSNSPAIKMYDAKVNQNQCYLDLIKYNWMRDIYMVLDSKYGKYGNALPSDQFNLGYGLGATLKLPISAFVEKNKLKTMANMVLDESVYNKEIFISELKKTLIKQYHQAVYFKQLINIRIEALEMASINLKITEKEFKNGLIQVDQYSRVSEIYYTQLQLLEESKMELKTSLSVLLEMAGISSKNI